MVLRILPVLLLTLILSDVYLYFKFMYGRRHPLWAYFLFFLPNALLLIAALILTWTENHTPENMTQMVIFFSLYMLIALPKMLFLIVDLIGKGICLFSPVPKGMYDGKFRRVSPFALYHGSRVEFRPNPLASPPHELLFGRPSDCLRRLPHRAVQRLAPHKFQKPAGMVEKVVERIMEQCPDMIVFTGDLVSTEANELDGFDEILSRLHAPDGVYSILGNHDYLTYAYYLSPEEQAAQREELKKRQRAMNWDLLLNEHRIIRQGRDSIALVGVENDGKPPFPERGDLKKALAGIPGYGQGNDSTRMFKVLLSHDPTHWRRKVLPQTDIQLTLSGHTHGMQFMLFGWSPSKFFYPEWKYMYREGERGLYVSLGIGGALIPFRFGAWPEINVITLHNK